MEKRTYDLERDLWNMMDHFRGKNNKGNLATLALSVALMNKTEDEKITKLLQEGNITVEKLIDTLKDCCSESSIYVPNFVEEVDSIMKEMGKKELSNFLFFIAETLKKISIQEFTKGLNPFWEETSKFSEHGSSSDINELSLKILSISNDESFLDPTCGFGNAIVSLLNKNPKQQIFGQDINATVVEIAKVRAILLDATNTCLESGDVLESPQYIENKKLKRFDTVYSSAPFSLMYPKPENLENDPYNRYMYGIPPKNNADWAFISNGISSLNETGRGVFVTSLGVLFRGAVERKIRSKIISLDLVEAVISLPAGLLSPYTAIPISLLIINKNKSKSRKGKILMVNAEDIYSGNRNKFLSESNIEEIYSLYISDKEIEKKSKLIALESLEEDNLLPSRYIIDNEIDTLSFGKVKLNLKQIKSLKMVPLKNGAKIMRGYNVTAKDEDPKGEYAFIKISDVQNGTINYKSLSRCNIKPNTKVENYQIKKGDLLISARGSETKMVVIEEDAKNILFTQNFNCARPTGLFSPHWLKLYLESPLGQFELNSKSTGTTVSILQPSDMGKIQVPVIEIEEQEKIASDYKKQMLEVQEEIEKLERKKRNIMLNSFSKMGLEDTFEVLSGRKEE